jgi:Tol biopolymer transport system component
MRLAIAFVVLIAITVAPCAAQYETQLTTNAWNHKHPAWCGVNIVFQSDRFGTYDIYGTDQDNGSTEWMQTSDMAKSEQRPSWMGDCQFVYFQMRPQVGGDNGIYQVNSPSPMTPIVLTTGIADERAPDWGAGGVLFHSDRSGNDDIIRMSLSGEGSGSSQLTSNAAEDRWADWSPDGSLVAFSSNRSGNFDIWVMHAAGEADSVWQLTDDVANEIDPAWSPNGRWVAFSRGDPDGIGQGIFAVDVTNGDVMQITSGATDGEPCWSPDGKTLAFSRQGANWQIWKTTNVPASALVESSTWGRIKAIYR